jgi:hypothetical protein
MREKRGCLGSVLIHCASSCMALVIYDTSNVLLYTTLIMVEYFCSSSRRFGRDNYGRTNFFAYGVFKSAHACTVHENNHAS